MTLQTSCCSQFGATSYLCHKEQRLGGQRSPAQVNGERKTQAPSIFSARRLGLSPAFKVVSKASVLREFGGAQEALTLMGEGLKQPLLLAFSWKADSANPQPKGQGMHCGVRHAVCQTVLAFQRHCF